jgi:hypothetical protein
LLTPSVFATCCASSNSRSTSRFFRAMSMLL